MDGGQATKTRRVKRGIAGVSGKLADDIRAMTSGKARRKSVRIGRATVVSVESLEHAELTAQEARANMRVVLTAWPAEGVASPVVIAEFTVATRDPSDRAHNVHEPGTTLLMNGAAVAGGGGGGAGGGGGRLRRYPPSQMTSRGVAFDSSYDELHARQSWLERQGAADLGTHTGRASGGDYTSRLQGAGYLAAKGLSVRAVVDRNRSAWDCGAMPVW